MQRLFDLAMTQSEWLADRAYQLVNASECRDHPMLRRINWQSLIQRLLLQLHNTQSVKQWLTESGINFGRQHRTTGVQISDILSIVKILRQCFDELIDQGVFADHAKDRYHRFVSGGCDYLEEVIRQAWSDSDDGQRVVELEQMVRALVGQRFRYEGIFYHIPDPILVLDQNGWIKAANPAADELLVGAESSVIGKRIGDAIPWLGDLIRGFEITQGQSLVEVEAQTFLGQRQFQVKITSLPVQTSDQESEIMVLLTDVTPLREKGSQLLTTTEELRILNDYALELADASVEIDIFGLVAKRLRQLTGALYTVVTHYRADVDRWCVYAVDGSSEDLAWVEELLGRSPVGLDFHMDEQTAVILANGQLFGEENLEKLTQGCLTSAQAKQAEALLGTGECYALAFVYKGRAVGTAAFVMPSKRPLDKSKARVLESFARLSAIAVQRSIAERHRQCAEAALEEEEARYRELFETSCDGIVVVDAGGRFIDCNQAYLDLLGFANIAELQKKTIAEITPPEYHDQDRRVHEQELVIRGYTDEYEKEYYRSDGSRVPVSIRAWAPKGGDGRPKGRWAIVRDISPLRRMEESTSIMETYRILGELAAAISHEVRNPLTTVRGFLQYFKSKPNYGAEDKEFFELMIKELDSATAIISDFLDTARPSRLTVQQFDITATVASLCRVMETRAMLQKVSLVFEAVETLTVRGDVGQIRQVLINLIQNAFQAMPDGGSLTVRCRKQNDMARVEITDTGVGIAPDNLEKIGRPFFTTKPGGSGLGLSTCYRIINSHHGRIEVESQVGKGTTFTCYLPLA